MARKIIDIGAVGNDGTGDSIRDSFSKVNENFLELYSSLGLGERLRFTGLSDAPSSYVGQEGALVTVNQTTTGLKFKQLVPGVGITVDQTTNPNEIKLNAVFSSISADRNPQLGGDLSAISGGNQYRILDLQGPTTANEASNKAYTDTKISRAGVDAIDPATGQVNTSFGRMTGPLILSRNPVPEDDTTFDGLIAATKSYVDSSAFGSVANLYVATSGADARPGVSDELQGRALAYAYRTIEAALKRAEELVLESRVEIGPYKKTLTYNNGAGTCTLSNISTSSESGSGFVGAALMSVDTITISAPGANYWVGDIITLDGGTVAPGGQAAKIQVLSTASTPGALLTFKILSSGVYSAIPGHLDVTSTASNGTKVTYGAGAKFTVTYKVNNVSVSNGGSGFGLVSVRITGGGGAGAFGTANVSGGIIQSVTVTDPGSGFTSVPTVVADLPTFAIYTAGKGTDFTGNYATNTLTAAATRDIRPGLYLRGETSGALAQILTHTGYINPLTGDELFDVDIKYGSFLIGEAISYGDITKNIQITVFVESGIYEENYPLKVPQNVSVIGDEFRRVLVKPKAGPSSSPWAFDLFRRDQTIDGLKTSDGLFRRHYLTDTSQPVYPAISNAGNYKAAAKLLALNKQWFQEEIIAWIDAQILAKNEPFDGGFTFNTTKCKRDVGLILNAVLADMVLGTNHLSVTAGNAYLRSYSSNVTSYQKGQTIAGIKKARDLALDLIYGSSTYVPSSVAIKALFDKVIFIIEDGNPATDVTFTNSTGLLSDPKNAAAILFANRSFIQAEVVGYINDTLTPGSIPGYSAATCSRDVGFIVNAILFDLIYGGTSESINAGLAYYNGAVTTVGGEGAAFTSVLNQLKVVIPQVISNGTTWANKSVSNTTSQVTNLTAASAVGAGATTINAALDIIKDIVINGPTAASAASPVAPTYSYGVNYALNGDRTTVLAGLSSLEDNVIAYLNATYSPGTFTYNYKLCKRDVGLIVDALVFDLRYGGYNRSISAALKYFQSASALKAITDQLDQTVATWQHLNTLAAAVLANTAIPSPAQTLLPQIIDNAYIAEVGTTSIVANLINAIIDIVSGSTDVNLPKDNNKIDVFLMNDATMLRRMTAQGHGGFMMVLDPTGQILAKSPYCQESASFIGSTGRKQFAGGMFVDGFAGNIEFRMSSAASTTKISISGLQRFPNLPASVIVSGSVYRINYIRDYVYGLPTAFVYDQTKCSRDVGLIVNAVLDDLIFNSNYKTITAAISYLRSYTSVVTSQQKVQTVAGINRARDLVLEYISDSTERATITTLMGIVTSVINAGSSSAAPSLTYTDPNNTDSGILVGAQELIDNRAFLIDEVIAYINATQDPVNIPGYVESTCRRDTGLLIDALVFDLKYGGNTATVTAADAYYNGTTNVVGTEKTQVIAAYTRLQSIIGYVIQANTSWTKSSGNVTAQSVSAGVGSGTAATTVSTLLGYALNIINGGIGAGPASVSPTYANGNKYASYGSDRTTVVAALSTIQTNVIKFLNSTFGSGGSSATMVLDPSTPFTFDVGPQTCTISNGSPAVITKIDHNLQAGATITFSTTGSLPTGLVAGQRYYVLLSGLGANTFSVTDTIGSIVPVATTSAGSGTHLYDRVFEMLMPGNRSMLSNDFTQVADLGYGVMVTNGGLTEAVSMFTYYCQISYYSINGGQIRSIAGSAAHGVYALVAEGSDPLEVPTPTDLYYDLAQAVTCYAPSGTYANSAQGVIIYITSYKYVPLPNSELEVDHGSGILYRYPVNSAYTGSDLPNGVARLTLGSTTGASGLSGLYNTVSDGTIMTVRQSQSLMLTGSLSGVAVRPSTGLVFTESANNVYRVLQFTDYTDPNGPFTCTISNANPAVITKSNHGLLADYTVIFSTTGTMPTGLVAGQTYYVLSTGLTQNTFQVSLLKGGGAVATSSAGSGTFSYTPTGLTTTLLRENYQYISMTVYTPNDYATIETTATATAQTTASMTGSSISGTTLTVGTLASGTIYAGMVLTGTSVVAGTYIVSNISGSGNGSTWTVSVSQTVSSTTITGTSNQVTLGTTTGMVVNAPIKFGISTQATATDGSTNYVTVGTTLGMVVDMPLLFSISGSAFGGLTDATVYYVKSVVSGTQITLAATQGGSTLTVTTGSGSMNVVTSGAFGGVSAGTTYYIGSVPASGKVTLSSTPHVTTTATATAITTASFTGSISGTTLTVTNVASGTITAGMVITGGTIAANTYIVSGTGTSFTVNTSQTVASTSISGTAYTVTVSNSGLMQRGQPIVFTGTAFGNIVSTTQYYIAAIPSSTGIVLSASSGLTSIFVLTNATGSIAGVAKHNPVTVSTASGSISAIQSGGNPVTMTIASPTVFSTQYAHGLVAGDVVKLETTGTLPTGPVNNAHYFVLSTGLTTTSFQLSLGPGGTAINASGTANAGTHTVSKVKGRAGDTWFAVVALGPYDRARALGAIFNWKGIDYVITRYDPETVTNTAFGRVYVSQINLTTGVQSGVGLNDSVVSYTSAITLKAGVRRGSANAEGTLTIRIALTRVTGHDLLDIGTGSYADTNYPNEIYGPAVNARNPAGEVVERSVGRVFYVTTDQYGNFRVGPYFSVDQGTGKVSFSAAIALSNLDGLGFKRGVPISEFSTDSSFANNATDTVPTQNATRIYLERRLGLTHTGAAVDAGQLIPINTGGFLALNGSLKMKGNLDINFNKLVNLSDPTSPQDAVNLRSMTFANFQDFSASGIGSAQLLTFTGTGLGAQNATMSGDVALSLNPTTHVLTATVQSGAIVNSKVSASAAIDQSKLNMNAATTRTNATGISQANLGLASFDDVVFTITNGWVTIKTNAIAASKLNQIAANTVLGNSSISTGDVTAVNFTTVVDTGGAIKKSQYGGTGVTGFLRRTGGTGASDSDYSIVEMSAAYTGAGDNGKLVNRDSSGNFAANEISISKLNVDSQTTIDTATAGTGGYIRYYGYNTVGGVLIQSGSLAADNKTLYWNDSHQFKTKDGGTDAPIYASSIQVQAITTGGNTTSGTITGRWTLTGTSPNESRLQSTYSADLAEYYEGDKEYEVGTVLVFGGEKEVTVDGKYANTRVAGVVSDTAAMAMYEACPGFKNLVALQGRVPCKVVGKIEKGDLLVTSKIAGVAVSAGEEARAGTIIGKALQTYDSDHIGTIEVAVGRF